MTERKLASIQRIGAVEPIEGADRIEMVTIFIDGLAGWHCVAKKGDFKTGDLCVYFEIDSSLPNKPAFSFLTERDRRRLKTRRFKGAISQGLALPLSIMGGYEPSEGTDVTEALEITNWEPPQNPQLFGSQKGTFPTHIVPKTDEERVQSRPRVLEEMKGMAVYITTKMDGTSYTAFLDTENNFGVCSRNLELKDTEDNVYWKITRKYKIMEALYKYYANTERHIAIQGEICGPGIQKNHAGLKDLELFVFNVYDIDNHRYLNVRDFVDAVFQLGLKTVPLCEVIKDFHETVDSLLERSKGVYEGTNHLREGIVLRPMQEQYSKTLQGRLSIKVTNNDYLLNE